MFSLREFCDDIFHDAILWNGDKVELLEIRNTNDQVVVLNIRKFLPKSEMYSNI